MPTLPPAYLIAAAVIILLVWIVYLEWRLHRLMRGKNGESLESAFTALVSNVQEVEKINEEIQTHLIKMEERLRRSIQHVKTVRFNPFTDQGGNQSFATAFLNEHGDGAVISTLYARERTSVFAKPIKGRASDHELSEEERQAIAK